MQIRKLYQDYNIPTAPKRHKHNTEGWVNTQCPYCTGNPGFHLGYSLQNNFYRCWRCGWHKTIDTISKLTHTSKNQAIEIIKKYKGKPDYSPRKKSKKQNEGKKFKFPSNTSKLQTQHRQYLAERGYNSHVLESKYNLKGTGPLSKLDGSDYKLRILAPIYWKGKIVSFQTRIIKDGVEPKYKACLKEREKIHHKHVLYGNQSEWGNTGICVEGITDVWRLGSPSFALFGTEYKREQVRKIIDEFQRVAIVFDDDNTQVIEKSKELEAELKFFGLEAFRVDVESDPGDMSDDDASHLVNRVISKSSIKV